MINVREEAKENLSSISYAIQSNSSEIRDYDEKWNDIAVT